MNFSGQDQKTYQGNQKRRIKYDWECLLIKISTFILYIEMTNITTLFD